MKYVVTLLFTILFSLPALSQLDPRERYGTYLGGSVNYFNNCVNCPFFSNPGITSVDKVITDSSGNIYVAGQTQTIDFPTTSGAYRRTIAIYCSLSCWSRDTFLAKFNASGQLLWATFLGAPAGNPVGGPPSIGALALDAAGNVIVVGAGYRENCGFSVYMLKINGAGSALVYSNVLTCGGTNLGVLLSSATVDSSGRYIYLGVADSEDHFPPTAGANLPPPSDPYDRILKIDTLSTSKPGIVYSAGAGATGGLANAGLAVDAMGSLYVVGYDTRVTKFNSLGQVMFSVNYLPSWASGSANSAAAVTSSGDLIFTENVSPQGAYPATRTFGPISTGNSVSDTVVVRLSGAAGKIVYATAIHDPYMTPFALAIDSAGEAFVTGKGDGTTLRVLPYTFTPAQGAFLLRLNSTGTQIWLDSTFGGSEGLGIVIDKAWNAFVVGDSPKGYYFPLTSNAYQSSFKYANSQGFLAKLIIEADAKMIQSASPNPITHGANLTYTLSVYNNGPDVSDGDTITDVLPSGTTFVSFSTTNGTCTHPNVGYGGTFKCTRGGVLNKASYWGPVTLTVNVNAAAGTTLKNTASVAAKTQDVVSSNNSATAYVKVQ